MNLQFAHELKIGINSNDKNGNKSSYIIGNCLTCCKTCNILKNKFSLEKILIQIYRICYKYNKVCHYYSDHYELKYRIQQFIKFEIEYINKLLYSKTK